ncbi:tetratricopeptide repeat protein [Hymenobacter yonginensis]|uniref:Tetratricopeptide repeat protein n=1 Tax=Hymenobacter yonginensis TaxID=748197 RepID=A0ABY7PU23_9BACT|nr:tetratricopeptide repeat protein [Hymenobacter yonginensis]WBO86400.1 tetratricopeptide repeat protein [Hymenobacter yonginensis]
MNYNIYCATLSISLITSSILLLSGCSPKGPLPKHESVLRALTEKRYEAAISKLDSLIAHQPDSMQHYMLRGYAQDELQNYAAGIADFTTAIQLDSSSATAYNNRGYAYYLSDQPQLAEQDYTRAIRIDSTFSPTLGSRALLYVAQSKYSLAIQDLDCALTLGDTLNSTYYNLKGYSELQLGNLNAAVQSLDKALMLDPAYTDARIHRQVAVFQIQENLRHQRSR